MADSRYTPGTEDAQSGVTASGWEWSLTPDRTVLLMSRNEPKGYRTLTVTWRAGATDEELNAALSRIPDVDMAVDERRIVRRIVLGRYRVYLHLLTGPPTWWLPKVKWSHGPMVGWLRLAVAIGVRREASENTAYKQGGDHG